MAEKEAKRDNKQKFFEDNLKEAIPPHILNIVQCVDKKSKNRKKEQVLKKQQSMDSITLIRNMMSSVRTKYELSEAAEEVRKDKENDNKMINNARDIFKNLEIAEEECVVNNENTKVKRVEIKPNFLLEGHNKAEELRQERLKEMKAMKIARERQIEEDERFQMQEKNHADELRKQREIEMEMMKIARQQALEEEQYEIEMTNKKFIREISPGIIAAKQALRSDQNHDLGVDNIYKLKTEREQEIAELRKQRAVQLKEWQNTSHRQENNQQIEMPKEHREKPRIKKLKVDKWMKQEDEDKIENIRREREMELEMMLNARNIAFEEEEEERLAFEALKREEAEKKGKEMAALVIELQRMRNETTEEETNEKMTRYQEEMMQRVLELKAIAQGSYMKD